MMAYEKKERNTDSEVASAGYEVSAVHDGEHVHDAVFGEIGDNGPNYRAVSTERVGTMFRAGTRCHYTLRGPAGQ